MPTEQELKITDLEKQLAVAKQHATLTDPHRAHLATLTGDDATAFLAKGRVGRDADVLAASTADVELYKSGAGVSYRKSGGQQLADMAKSLDEAHAMSKASRDAAEQVTLEKRASEEIGHLAGDAVTKTAALRAVNGIADEKTRTAVVAMLKGANAAMAALGAPRGYGTTEEASGSDASNPEVAYYAGRDEYAKANGLVVNTEVEKAKASHSFQKTAKGQQLYRAITDAQAAKVVR